MRKTALRQLEVLETEERCYQRQHHSSSQTTAFLCWKVVLAHHLGGLKPDDEDPGEAEARALKYETRYEYLEALFNGRITDVNKRRKDASARLFARVKLDFERDSRGALSHAFASLVNQLPEQWLRWIESNAQLSRNSRVFTQIGNAALDLLRTPDQLLLALLQREESKVSFWAFRRYTRPKMKLGWWQYEVAVELERFYRSLSKGERPKLVLTGPPRHGKTEQSTDFIAWVAGKNPALKTIFASYSDELGVRVNMALQRIMSSERYVAIFGHRLGKSGSPGRRNSNMLEYPNHAGYFYNTTVGGQITGMGLDLGIVDDPVKGRIEVNSKTVRDKLWQWFIDDFRTRSSDAAGLLLIMTRWHLDDPAGKLIECYPEIKILRYPAIAEEDEKNRRKGEALFPEHMSLPFLMEQKRAMSQASWESEYQQNPIVAGGGIFPIENLRTLHMVDREKISRSVRYVDKGGTEGDGAWTAMVLMHKMSDGTYVIEDVVRGRWSALEREEKIKSCAKRDSPKLKPGAYEIGVEQEPGSGGKESAEATIRNLAGYKVFADKVTGSKRVRAEPFAAQVQAGNVYLVAGPWHPDFLNELELFPSGKYSDQVDACSGAFNRLARGLTFNLFSGAW